MIGLGPHATTVWDWIFDVALTLGLVVFAVVTVIAVGRWLTAVSNSTRTGGTR